MATMSKQEAPRVTSSTINAHGARVYVVTSRSHAGEQLWLVSGNVCQCRGFQYRGHCAHVDAVHAEQAAEREAAREAAHEWLWDNCSSWL
jgi:hypothetical protein